MKFINDRILRDMNISTFNEYGKDGLQKKIAELEARIQALETPNIKKVGRPRKVPVDA